MDDSPFGKLPPEIRNRVYDLALSRTKPLLVMPPRLHSAPTFPVVRRKHGPAALTRTCRQIRAESSQLLFAANTFTLQPKAVRPYHQHVAWFLDTIGPVNSEAVKSISLTLDYHKLARFEEGVFDREVIEPLGELRWEMAFKPWIAVSVELKSLLLTSAPPQLDLVLSGSRRSLRVSWSNAGRVLRDVGRSHPRKSAERELASNAAEGLYQCRCALLEWW